MKSQLLHVRSSRECFEWREACSCLAEPARVARGRQIFRCHTLVHASHPKEGAFCHYFGQISVILSIYTHFLLLLFLLLIFTLSLFHFIVILIFLLFLMSIFILLLRYTRVLWAMLFQGIYKAFLKEKKKKQWKFKLFFYIIQSYIKRFNDIFIISFQPFFYFSPFFISSKGAEPEFRSPRVKLLWDRWRHVWMLAWERQRRLQDKYNYIQELDRVANFSWEDWRKRVRRYFSSFFLIHSLINHVTDILIYFFYFLSFSFFYM